VCTCTLYIPERYGGEDARLSSDCLFNANPDCRGKHRVYVYLNSMEVTGSLSRQTVPFILILTAGGSTACTVCVPERYGGKDVHLS
jgi:hypothetical protein